MTTRWQISAGELTEWLPPLLYAFSALASAWVLCDARRRRFRLYAVAAWTLATLVHAPVVLPLYLVARTFKPSPLPPEAAAAAETTPPEETEQAGLDETGATATPSAREETTEDSGRQVARRRARAIRLSRQLKRHAPSLIYAGALLFAGAIYFYRDHHSFDAHLARATNARLVNLHTDAIREYRAALRHADDAHTRKLLAVQLAEAGQTEAALAEFRAAERGGDPDELLPYRVAAALDKLGRRAEAAAEYRKFLRSGVCSRPSPIANCVEAAARVR